MTSDQFCGMCGTASSAGQPSAPWPDRAGVPSSDFNGGQQAVYTQADPSRPFFAHAPRRPALFLSNATRYLCAAPYLNEEFADVVIGELVASRRAVAPSIGIDLGPIIRHCLRARRIALTRDVMLVICLLVALPVNPLMVAGFLLVSLAMAILHQVGWRKHGLIVKLLIAFGYAVVFAAIGSFILTQFVGSSPQYGNAFFGIRFPPGSIFSRLSPSYIGPIPIPPRGSLDIFIILVAVMWAIQFTFLHSVRRTLSEELRPGAPASDTPSAAHDVTYGTMADSARIAAVEGAQRGNLTLYGGENPFIGTGIPAGDWSIAIELDRARPANDSMTSKGPEGYVPVDPVELHAVIRERLLKLNDPGLPGNERICGLVVDDAILGSGKLRLGSPLLDTRGTLPCSQSSPEAIDALIRHPQAALRYYQRVSVLDQGQPVTHQGRPVVDGVDQGVAASAFIYAAVEGRMFYLQFVRRALPPVHADYQVIDDLPSVSIILEALRSMPQAVISSLARLNRARRTRRSERRRGRGFSSSHGSAYKNFGARISVREYGAADDFDTYLEILDIEKYIKITERLLLDTVLDFLAKKGVDTSAFAASAGAVINGNVSNVGTIQGGNIQFGNNNHMQAAPASISAT